MGTFIVRTARDRDQYMEWSKIAEAPTAIGTRAEMLAQGVTSDRLLRAASTGTSMLNPAGYGGWDHNLIYKQFGILPRDAFARAADALLIDDEETVLALLLPFESDSSDEPSKQDGSDELRAVTIQVCQRCLDGEGGECHTPGCWYWLNDGPTEGTLERLRDGAA